MPLQQAVAEFDPDYEDELCRLRCDIASLRLDWEITKLAWKARKYNPDQPRVPTGNPDGGQWTSEGAQGTPLRVAGPGVGRSAGSARFPNATPAQQARFAVADARAQDALRRVREIDPNWRPQTGAYGTSIESEILKANDLAAAAQARINELARVGGRRRSSCTRINSGTRNGL